MGGIINTDNFNFCGITIQSIKELVFDEVLNNPTYQMYSTLYTDIQSIKEIGFITGSTLVGVTNQGCNPTPQPYSINTRSKKWEPEEWEVLLAVCYADLRNAMTTYSRNKGANLSNLEGTDYESVVKGILKKSIQDFFFRLAWFGDKAIKNVVDGGNLTNGIDVKYFNINDGFFKLIKDAVTVTGRTIIPIAENTLVGQEKFVNPSNVQGYLQSVLDNSDLMLKQTEGAAFYVTRTVYEAYKKSLQGLSLEILYTNLTNGVKTLAYDGYPLIPMDGWDIMIKEYFNNGSDVFDAPHRILFTSPKVLGTGVDSDKDLGYLKIWYENRTRELMLETMRMVDFLVLNDNLVTLAM